MKPEFHLSRNVFLEEALASLIEYGVSLTNSLSTGLMIGL
jgi:hypothetical protein